MKETIEVKERRDGTAYIEFSYEMYKALLASARTSQKGRRGLSSKKKRVKKKIANREVELALLRSLNE